MDPNATLARIRVLIATPDLSRDAVDELAELIGALDHWLTSGGFPPEAWHYDPRGDA